MNKYKVLVAVLLIIALLPFCYACMYALPYADDFCIGWELLQGKPLLTSIAEQYLYWNGRYTSNVFFNLDPIATSSLMSYSTSVLLLLLAAPIAFYVLVKQVVAQTYNAIIVSLMLSLLYVNYMPNLTEGIFWYIGSVNYHLGAMLSIVQLSVFVKLYQWNKRVLYMPSILLLVLAVGFNEVGAMLIPMFYFALLVFNYKQKSVNRKLIAIHFVAAVIASAFVVFSPGNATRLGEFSDKYNFFHSAFYASLQTVRFTGLWILSYPFIACSILAAVYADRLRDTVMAKIDWRIALAGAFGVVFMAAFIPYFATGILGQHRTMNYVYPFFLLWWFVALVSLSNEYDIIHDALRKEAVKRFLVLSSIAVLYVTGNSLRIWTDVAANNFVAYKEEYLQRQAAILVDKGGIQLLEHIPATFNITDARTDSTYWVNRCMLLYYEKNKAGLR